MKPKIIFVSTALSMLLISAIVIILFPKTKDNFRYHQHIEDKTSIENPTSDEGSFNTHLPIISIDTKNQKIPGEPILDELGNIYSLETGDNGETEIKVNIDIVDNEEGSNHPEDEKALSSDALIRIRGNSSRRFDKKSYQISFVDDEGNEKNEKVMGMPEYDEWALYGPFLDKTLMRNYMWMNISSEIMGYAPNVRFCECFVDGEYKGLYLMMETVARSDNRVNISKYSKGDLVSSYIVCLDEAEDDIQCIDNFTYYTLNTEYNAKLSVVYPGRSVLTPQIADYIKDDISSFEKSLYSFDFKDLKKGYRAYIDVDSFVDYYVLQEFLLNNDMCSRSTYLYKDVRGKLHMGPVWDYNNVLDNFIRIEFDGTDFHFTQRTWYKMLLKDEYFVNKVIQRYKELRKTYLSEDYLMNYIDDTISYLGMAVDRNFSVWGYSFERENQKPGISRRPIELNPTSYEEAVSQLKQTIKARGNWMDENIEILRQYCHESKNKHFLN